MRIELARISCLHFYYTATLTLEKKNLFLKKDIYKYDKLDELGL